MSQTIDGEETSAWHKLIRDKAHASTAAKVARMYNTDRRQTMLTVRDPEHREAYSIAHPHVQHAMDEAVQFCGRYLLTPKPIHHSKTCYVLRAIDRHENDKNVVVKLSASSSAIIHHHPYQLLG